MTHAARGTVTKYFPPPPSPMEANTPFSNSTSSFAKMNRATMSKRTTATSHSISVTLRKVRFHTTVRQCLLWIGSSLSPVYHLSVCFRPEPAVHQRQLLPLSLHSGWTAAFLVTCRSSACLRRILTVCLRPPSRCHFSMEPIIVPVSTLMWFPTGMVSTTTNRSPLAPLKRPVPPVTTRSNSA